MARRRYRRYRRRRSKWAVNIKRFGDSGTVSPNSHFVDYIDITQNPEQEDSAVSQIFTVKNIEIACQLESGSPNVESIEYYIMYIPEGYPLPDSRELPIKHPEWIMAYKYVGSGNGVATGTDIANSNAQVPKIKTRLSRKLQPGDQIKFVICGYNYTASNVGFRYTGLLRWWTKSN